MPIWKSRKNNYNLKHKIIVIKVAVIYVVLEFFFGLNININCTRAKFCLKKLTPPRSGPEQQAVLNKISK